MLQSRLGKINICASGIIIKKIGKPPLLWKGKGGSMKGGSIIMADLDQGRRGAKGSGETEKKDGVVTAEVFV